MNEKTEMSDEFYRHIAQTSEDPMGLEVDYAEGPYIYTRDGDRYVDLISGIAVSVLGHRHPEVIEAVKAQLNRHMHVMVYGEYIQEAQVRLASRLTNALPERMDQIYLVNSGTEANEGALKLAKKATGRTKFVSFNNSYHGDTQGSLSVTGRAVYQDPYKPLLPNVTFLDFNDDKGLDAIDRDTAAVIMEPIQGEGGIVEADETWLKEIRKCCEESGTLLIFDEIQTGFHRTGTLFAFQDYEVTPDIMTLAKALGGGMPLGGIVAGSELFKAFKQDPPLNHVTTFGGHPVSCAAADASLKILLEGEFEKKVQRIERETRSRLNTMGVREIRGKGAMLGAEMRNRELTREVVEECLNRGIILGWTLHSETLIRLAPPLNIDRNILCNALDTIKEVIEQKA